ncbi:uncharacterized protein LOC126901536 isoform X2 [Daktulosphaira vitifoliae]|uniref:uncharacterized protein LOC126901536 isoform X2 n=1 Tax=Daktulosphaira vitifoliae TaxID=58002 RepID=UPI0021A9C66F|nr:uncharacterized protein LOC126901536 isoform X2 [Daktulosphaira vitifoliae]
MAVKAIFSYICYTFLLSLAARINAIFPIEIETSLLNLRLFLNKNSSDFNVLKKSIKEIHETLPKKSNGELDNNFNVNTDIFKNWQTLTQEIFKHAADETGQNINIDSFINNLNYTSKKKNQLQSEIRIKYNGSSGFLSWTALLI